MDHWVDEAAERFGEFSIGAYGFAVELRIDDEVELGWAYGGAMSPGAAELFGRAAEQARGGVDRGDGRGARAGRGVGDRGAQARAARAVVGDGLRRAGGLGAVQGQRLAALPGAGGPRRAGVQVLLPERGSSRASTRWRCCCCGRRARRRRAERRRGWPSGCAGARRARSGRRAEPGEPARDPEAAARRAAEREARVAGGVEDLRRWLRDAVRGGLGAGRLRAWEEWDAFAARMVDAQAPGRGVAAALAGRASPRGGRTAGPSGCCAGSGMLHLLCEAFARRRTGRCATTCGRCSAGTSAREEVLGRAARAGPLGGARAGRDRAGAPARPAHVAVGARRPTAPALLLDFAPPGAPLEPRPAPGTAFEAGLAFSPGRDAAARAAGRAGRALRRRRGSSAPAGSGARWRSVAGAVALNPWLEEWPVALARAVPDARRGHGRAGTDGVAAAAAARAPRGGGCWRSPAGARCRCSGCGTARRLRPLAAGDGERTVAL